MANEFKTKQDFQNCVLELSENVKPFFTPDRAHIKLGYTAATYDDDTIGLEGFARLLWGLVPLWAGSDSDALLDYIQTGIRNGTNPNNPAYWGALYDEHQAFVEMTPIALGLLLTPDRIWTPLSQDEKDNFATWLLQINQYNVPQNNWLFFRILVNVGLMKVNAQYSQQAIDDAFKIIETFYLGDGWYSDGVDKRIDYYIAFAIHFYALIYARFMRAEDPERCTQILDRAKIFANDFIYWFSENGAGIPFGRSLTYRFAQSAFWSALAFADDGTTNLGVTKGLIARNIRQWFEKPIYDGNGILTIGYGYPDLNMAEGYNSPSSPLWAFKSFLILALPDNHSFWSTTEQPLPVLEATCALPHPIMIIQRSASGDVIALTSGQYPAFDPVHTAEKYAKFAYSTHFSFNVPRSYHTLAQVAPDNMLAFIRDGMYFVRRECSSALIDGINNITSFWKPFPNVEVKTIIEPSGNGHIRTHSFYLDFECDAVECGFPLPVSDYAKMQKDITNNTIVISAEGARSMVRSDRGNGTPGEFLCEPNTNINHPRTALPYLAFHLIPGTYEIRTYCECGTGTVQ